MDLMGGAIYSEYLLVLAIFPFFANYPEKDDDSYDIRWNFYLEWRLGYGWVYCFLLTIFY